MILVTGATGLLGSHLLLDLVKTGVPVRATKRKTSNTGMVSKIFSYYSPEYKELASRIEWVEADLLDDGAVEDALQGISTIYHAGAMVSFHPGDRAIMLKTNIEGTANLVNQAIAAGVEKFCHVSSIATLGRAENNATSTEETYWVPSGKNSVYGISKYGAEREVWRGIEEGLNAVIINPSVILGPGFWHDNSSLFRLVYQGLKFYTRGVNGFVDVRDVSAAMIRLVASGYSGERYICSAANIPYRQLFTLMAMHLGKPAPSVYVTPALTRLAWRAEAFRAFLTRSKPEITRETATTASQSYAYSADKLKSAIDFNFRPVEDSVRDFCTFYLNDAG